jgi:hypothetical protein
VATAGVVGLIATEFSNTLTVIMVELTKVFAPRVALTKMPTVPVLVPALNVTDEPLPVSVPSVLLVRVHTYVMLPGQVLLQVGVAVMSWFPLVNTTGVPGVTVTDDRVTAKVMVMTVEATFVTPPRVALT